jgi:hypothetical protein
MIGVIPQGFPITIMCETCGRSPAGVTHICAFGLVGSTPHSHDTSLCARCEKPYWEHIQTDGIGAVCPVQVTVFKAWREPSL